MTVIDKGDGPKIETEIPLEPTAKLSLELFAKKLKKSNSLKPNRPVRLTEYIQPIGPLGGLHRKMKPIKGKESFTSD